MSESEKASESGGGGPGSTSTNTGTGGGGSGGAAERGGRQAPQAAGERKRRSSPAPRRPCGTRTRRKSKQLPPYNVILLDDNFHTYAYVIEMLRKLFGHPDEKGTQLAREVDSSGRVIVMTTHKELAELKRDQIHAFGADWRLENSKGSMSSKIEPAK